MRLVAVLAALMLAGCGAAGWDVRAVQARKTCTDNGHALGSPGFDACFHRIYAASHGVAATSAPLRQ
jgi:hypothetical protein